MKINLKIGYTIIFATVLLVNLAMIPVSAIDNESKVEYNISDVPQFETWVKPLDLSEYNGHKPQVKKEPLSAEALEKIYPYIIALNESEKKEFNSISREESLFDVNFEPNGKI